MNNFQESNISSKNRNFAIVMTMDSEGIRHWKELNQHVLLTTIAKGCLTYFVMKPAY